MISLIKPQLAASEIPDIFTEVTWPKIIQPKLDGICCLAVNGAAYSRTMKLIPNKYVQKVFKELNLHGLHGELMVKGDFNDVQSVIMKEEGESNFEFVVYDYWDSDEDYQIRKIIIEQYCLPLESVHVDIIPSYWVFDAGECENKLNQYIQKGYEGAILRDPTSLYKQGRCTLKSQSLLKLKTFQDDEAVVTGFEEKLHNNNIKEKDERGYSKRSSKKEGLVLAGTLGSLCVRWRDFDFKVGSGFTDLQRKDIWENRNQLIGKRITFKYQELSKYGIPRFPIWKCFREEE